MTRILALVLFSVAAFAARAQDADLLFESLEPLDIVIHAPFKTIASERSDEEELDGRLDFPATDGSRAETGIKIRARGNFRRDKRVCAFPPLRVNFRTSEMEGTVFENQDKLKLVTHCRRNNSRFEQAVIREYLAYRIFNLMTEHSFRVRLLRVRYEYTDDSRVDEGYGFFIEDEYRLAERIDLPPFRIEKTRVRSLDLDHLQLNSVFQYLIANTDFSPISSGDPTSCCHNHKLFGREGEPMFSIPYDFDMSGFVDAPYARPNSRFAIRSVTDRLYRGRCLNNPKLQDTISAFQDKREAIFELLHTQQELDTRNRRSLLRFTRDFYKVLDNPKLIERELIDECIG